MATGFAYIQLHKKSNRGFTLVELVIGITILAIMAAVAVPVLLAFVDYQKNDRCRTEAATILAYMQAEASKSYDKAIGKDTIKTYFDTGDFLLKAATATDMKAKTFALVIMKEKEAKIATPQNKNSWTIGEMYYFDREAGIWLHWDGVKWESEQLLNRKWHNKDVSKIDTADAFKTLVGVNDGYAIDGYMNMNVIWNTGW